jgi:branched-chain amino acid transport system substrate-binding protein
MPSRRFWLYRFVTAAAALAFAFHHPVTAQDQKPIRIGFSIAQTGPLSAAGKSGLLALQIWRDDVNARGGLLGRQIELVVYDDQGNASMTPGIYTKLIDVDKVDLLIGPYGTNPTASIMPLIKQRDLLLMGNFALEANSQLRHDKYFNNQPWSSARDGVLPFMDLCRKLGVSTIAVLAADAEYGQKIANGIRAELTAFKLQAVYDQNYPPNTVDFSSMLRAIRSKKPDAVFVASYPAESTAIIRALNEQGVGDSVKLFGGGMVGLQYASVMESMGSQLNGVVNYHSWAPEKSLDFPGMRDFLARYQSKAKQANVDPLGYYLPPYNYAMGQILALAVNATTSLDHKKLAQYIHTHDLPTIVGSVHYGPTGEWANSRMIYVQFRGVVDKDLDQFRQSGRQVIVAPDAFKTGEALPFNQAHK